MKQPYALKIDVFSHIIPAKYGDAFLKASQRPSIANSPALYDLDLRFRIMDKYEGLMQVLTLGLSAGIPDEIADLGKSADLAKLANDEMAELVFKYTDRFPAAVACLPMNNIDAALKEVDRAINDLKFRGVQIYTPTNDKPLDSPEFMPLYEKMSQYNLPIWIHPWRFEDYPDYRTEKRSTYIIASLFGWPYETTTAMTRLVFSGILEKYPNLKFITHHCGGMVPYLAARITQFYDIEEMLWRGKYKQGLTKLPIEYFKMFYADTALCGNAPALMCGYGFFGAEHLLFGTDMPYDNQHGDRNTREILRAIEEMNISDSEKKKIYEDNVRSLLRLAA